MLATLRISVGRAPGLQMLCQGRLAFQKTGRQSVVLSKHDLLEGMSCNVTKEGVSMQASKVYY